MTDENKINRESFIFYRSFFDALVGMDKENQADCLMAIADYALNGKDPTLTPAVRMFFTLVKPQLDANQKKYESGCKGASFGKFGGRPRKNPNETPQKPQENPKPTPNDNDNDNVNEKENCIKEKSVVDNVDNFCGLIKKVGSFNKKQIVIGSQFNASDVDELKLYVKEMPDDVIHAVEKWLIKSKLGQTVDVSFIAKQFINFAKRMNRPVFKDLDKGIS